MTTKFKIKFEVDVINPKAKTLSIGRKQGTSTLHSELTHEELLVRQPEVAAGIAKDLTSQGLMLFSAPEIKSIKEDKKI